MTAPGTGASDGRHIAVVGDCFSMFIDSKQLLWQGCEPLSLVEISPAPGSPSARSYPGSSAIPINGQTSPGTAGREDFETFDLGAVTYPSENPAGTPRHAGKRE